MLTIYHLLMSASLSLWMMVYSPSVILLSLLIVFFSSSLGLVFFMGSSTEAYLIILVVVGGLFISVSFVILACTYDLDKIGSILWSIPMFFVFFFTSEKTMESYWESSNGWKMSNLEISSSMLSMGGEWSFIFILLVLLLALKLVDGVMHPSSGCMFSK